MIGKVLGNRYRVLRELGSGGMAWVYLAEDSKENRLVAVKILYPQFGEDLSYIQRFDREAKLASTLTDPHIVRVLDYGADRDVHYLVMEYVEGQDLREALNYEGRFPWKDALEILDQLAAALEHAHLHGVVHRDIKPQNIMMDGSGILKVLDFGIARVPTLPSLTQSGFIGSPYYVSPEQAMGEEVDTRADIYSAGIVLYELLSGTIPFDAKSPWSIISQHIANEPPPIDLAKEEIPEGVRSLLDRMIAKRPEDRFQTPGALRRAIAAVLAGKPIPDNTLDTQPIEPVDRHTMATSLYQRAEEAIEAEEWARAVDLLSQALTFNPDHAEAAAKLTVAEREAQLASLYNSARRAIQGGLWEEAITNLHGILGLEPDYRDTRSLLEEAREALKNEDTQKFVMTRYDEGLAHFEARRWDRAAAAFQEVKQLDPHYEKVEQLLVQAQRRSHPNLFDRLSLTLGEDSPKGQVWRWSLLALGILVIVMMTFLSFGNRNQTAAEDADAQQHLKSLYEEAQQAIKIGDRDQAIGLLDQILKENPDYADVASLKRELVATLTPVAGPAASLAPTPDEDPFTAKLRDAQKAVEGEQWDVAVDLLLALRASDNEHETALVASLLCDAYVGRGLDIIGNLKPDQAGEKEVVGQALADFEAGVKECPRRTDLRDQADRATAYLEALNTPVDEYETLIQTLTPVVAADPKYAGNNAKKLLYAAYLGRGKARQSSGETVGALSDYEAALSLNVDDPSEAQQQRAALLLSFSSQPQATPPTPEEPAATAESGEVVATSSTEEATPSTPGPVQIKYAKPQLVNPPDDTVFAGKFSKVFLEWQPVGHLAEDEYYDLTIMHIFADEPAYWGMATTDTQVQLTADIGVGQAGQDRFYWWVTVRKANTAPSRGSIDLPVSLQSEARTFVWTP